MPEKLKRKWFYDNDEGDAALESIKRRYGFVDNSTALRFVIRLVASPDAVVVKVAGKDSKIVTRVKKSLEG